ncbi:hypothetical protein [Acidomonas methanolica]|uniref:Uncharacterized protein n=1 Tax=Acidomonas methanolica NBRC 104435 TaxID=1231351 RepID=A0A023D8Y6_ACIMT|nr:hypothetical protein [Acidomonas methanolica]MBU2654233.1 hypothetical protein [Acidomonas methanolica]TCS29335.1 hypothetical protein EDC31_107107 [Acidomonas methanolica]GAJ30251.1 hypothetical protein Amme_114_008 [Acidomonas methanolica NBRC 104435]GBQ49513.1 hypothetical protein AA0498_1000 [Acidomonas methanolica]GEK99408.1 hypothetical protein AME01nite_19070 [Acidomonas methanolica NBRC 104435]
MRYLVLLSMLMFTPAMADEIDVHAAYRPVVVSNLRRMAAACTAIGQVDGKPSGLTLHVFALLEPGDRRPQDAHVYLAATSGKMPLLRGADAQGNGLQGDGAEIMVPSSPALLAENPDVVAALTPDETLTFKAVASLDQPPGAGFTDRQARGWLHLLDARMAAWAGVIFALFVPDAQVVTVTVAPRSELDVMEGGAARPLVINHGDAPWRYSFRPADFSDDAVFSATRAIMAVDLPLPVTFRSWKWRK